MGGDMDELNDAARAIEGVSEILGALVDAGRLDECAAEVLRRALDGAAETVRRVASGK